MRFQAYHKGLIVAFALICLSLVGLHRTHASTIEKANLVSEDSTSAARVAQNLGLTHDEVTWIRAHPVITFGGGLLPPFHFQGKADSPIGISLDYLKRIGKILGMEFRFVTEDWKKIQDQARNKEIDGITAIYKNEKRLSFLNFTVPYADNDYAIVMRKSSPPVSSYHGLINKKIAAVKGSYGQGVLRKNYPKIKLQTYADYKEVLKALLSGDVDAAVGPLPVLSWFMDKMFVSNLTVTGLPAETKKIVRIGIRKDWPQFISILNKAMGSVTAEQFRTIAHKWVKLDLKPRPDPFQETQVFLTEDEKQWLKAHPVITFGGGLFPPFEFLDDQGTPIGISQDYLKLIGKKLGMEFRFVSDEWKNLLNDVRHKKLDGITGIYKNELRAEYIHFSIPYAENNYAIVMRRSSPPVSSYQGLANMRVATIKKSLGEEFIRNNHPQIRLYTQYANYEEVLNALVTGEVEAVVGPLPVLSWFMDKLFISDLIVTGLTPETKTAVRIGIRKDWPEFVTILNKTMVTIPKSQLRSIFNKWVKVDLTPLQEELVLSAGEKQWLKTHPVIRVGSDPSWAPMEFATKDGKAQGIAIDYLRIVEKRLGIHFQIVSAKPWHKLMEDAKAGKIDMLSCAAQTPEREKFLSFTSPYLTSSIVIFSRPDMPYVGGLEELNDKKVVVIESDAIHETIAQEYPGIHLVTAPDIDKAISMLDKEVVAFIGSPINTSYYIMEHGESMIKVVGETPLKYELAMASRSDWPVFSDILQKALDSIGTEERTRIYRKWISVSRERDFDYTLLWKISGGALAVVCLFLFWNRRLKSEVDRQTATIKQNEIFLHNLLDAIPTPVYYKDVEGRYLGINRASEEFYGLAADKIVGKTVFDVQPSDVANFSHEKDVELLESGKEQRFEYQIRQDNNDVKDYIVHKAVFADTQGAVSGLIGTILDISELKQAEKALRGNEARLQVIFDNAPAVMLLLNEDREILKINQVGLTSSGRSLDRLKGLLICEIFNCVLASQYAENRSNVCLTCEIHKAVEKTFETNKNFNKVEVRLKKETDGKTRDQVFLVSTNLVSTQSPKEVLVTLYDITEIKSLETQLRQVQKMEAIGTLAGGIAHDFNNILSAILGYGELVKDYLKNEKTAYKMQEQVLSAVGRAKDLVNQILLFSRQTETEIGPVQPHLIVKEALKLLRASIPSTIDIKQNIPAEGPCIIADPTQIHQVVMNLCTNAFHAMQEDGGTLSINLTHMDVMEGDDFHRQMGFKIGGYLKMEISDTGSGMTASTLEKIFDPYFTTKSKGQGTGLGLSVVHGIVKTSGGYIKAYSEPQKGTTFHVYFPSVDNSADVTRHKGEKKLPTGNARICLVDDDLPILEMTQFMLEKLGYKVICFDKAKNALLAFQGKTAQFDLLITDLTMPEMTGVELTKQIHLICPDIPVILCTGFSELINENQAREIGIGQLLTKPILRSDLAYAIHNALSC